MVVEIVSIDKAGDEFEGMVAFETTYRPFITNGLDIVYGFEYQKSDYQDYEHFAAVYGKFEPYMFFLEKPVPIESMTRSNIEKVWVKVK